MKQKLKALLKRGFGRVTHNLGLKILSILVAIFVWNYVISSNSSYTRTKTVSHLTAYLNGESTLNDYGLALATDPTAQLRDVMVMVEVAQSEYSYVSAENVNVTINLGSIRTEGTREVPLRATSTYGRVVNVYPSTVTVTFEPMDSREVPVNAQLTGGSEDMWYSVADMNPSVLTVSGAKSMVDGVAAAYVYLDVTDVSGFYTATGEYQLLSSTGEALDDSMLFVSSSSVSLDVLAYPKKNLSVNAAGSVTGTPAEGYVVTGISVQPEAVTVAAEESLLSELSEITVGSISVDGASQSFSTAVDLVGLSGLQYLSSREVIVTVSIEEVTESAWVEELHLNFVGKSEGLDLDWMRDSVAVYVTGPRSLVSAAVENGLQLTVDLTGLKAGTHKLQATFDAADSGVVLEPESVSVIVTLTPSLEAP